MDDFRDLMYDLIIESLVDKLENYEITMEDAEIFSEAAYDELFYEGFASGHTDRKLKKNTDASLAAEYILNGVPVPKELKHAEAAGKKLAFKKQVQKKIYDDSRR